jgi:hypothetical protein
VKNGRSRVYEVSMLKDRLLIWRFRAGDGNALAHRGNASLPEIILRE